MKKLLKQWWCLWLSILFVWGGYHLYFQYLSPVDIADSDLYYLDFLLLVLVGSCVCFQLCREYKMKKEIEECITREDYIEVSDLTHSLGTYEKLALHNETVYEKEQEQAYQSIQELQEYISRWSHEIKLPLAALQMMNERNEDVALRGEMKEQCEKLDQLLHTMLTGCKTWNTHYDKSIAPVSLKEIITKSIRHQSYFLIKERFTIQQKVGEERVLSDEQWLVYILDQLLHNAIKYHKENPTLTFYTEAMPNCTILHIRDEGIGIKPEDLQSVFDKGYTGRNVRNGEYRSTGMGLYFVKRICELLEHSIQIESKENAYTDVMITFRNHLDYFNVTEM